MWIFHIILYEHTLMYFWKVFPYLFWALSFLKQLVQAPGEFYCEWLGHHINILYYYLKKNNGYWAEAFKAWVIHYPVIGLLGWFPEHYICVSSSFVQNVLIYIVTNLQSLFPRIVILILVWQLAVSSWEDFWKALH